MFADWLAANQTTIVVGLIFMAVLIVGMAVVSYLSGRAATRRRLAGETGSNVRTVQTDQPDSTMQVLRNESQDSVWSRLVGFVGNFAESFQGEETEDDEDGLTALQLRLIQAGYLGSSAVRQYFVFRLLLAVSLPLIFLMQAPFFSTTMTAQGMVFTTILLVAVGLYIPVMWTGRKRKNRMAAISTSFPDAIDMMVVCVEAGLGLDAAFNKVGAQITIAHPVLAQLFATVSLELRGGKARADALRNFADRSGVPAISSFVTLLVQSDTLGASISQTLRVHADEMRANRTLRAEEKAAMLPVLLSIPLVTCILPAMLSVILLPGAITIIRQVLPLLAGTR